VLPTESALRAAGVCRVADIHPPSAYHVAAELSRAEQAACLLNLVSAGDVHRR